MITETAIEEPEPKAESDDSKRCRLSDEVKELVALTLHLQDTQKKIKSTSNRIYRLAVDELKIIHKPSMYGVSEHFCCDGFMVSVGKKEYESLPPEVRVTEFGQFPKV